MSSRTPSHASSGSSPGSGPSLFRPKWLAGKTPIPRAANTAIRALSMDNVFVIALIFGFLGIPRLYQHRVLF